MLRILLAAAALLAPLSVAAQTVVTVNGHVFEVPPGTTTTFGMGPDGPYVMKQVAAASTRPAAYAGPRSGDVRYQPAVPYDQYAPSPQAAPREPRMPEPRLDYADLGAFDEAAPGEARVLRVKRDRASGHFLVNVRINGVMIRAIFDTGAAGTILSPEDAAATGVDRDVTHVRPGIGIGGYTTLRSTRVRSLEIGGQRLGSFPADIGQSGLPTLLGQPEIAKLGRIVIEDGVMEIRPRGVQTASR